MQYYVATLLTLLGLANKLQCTEINGVVSYNSWSSRPRVRLEIYPRIEEWPHNGPGKKLVLHKKNEPLNMTCTVVHQNGEKDDDTLLDYDVDWKGPRHVNNNPKIKRGQSRNTAWIWFESLMEMDAGDYTCIAISQKPSGHYLSVPFYLFVEHKPTYCGSQWFKCRSKNCIMERYVCDGKPDCEEGEDETPAAGCGLDPCFGKVLCEDRCIPPEWCCDHRNCSGTFGLRPWPHENHEISYVQTAFYTVIGCAMAFMFIVTILVIAICRVQIKRAMNSRCSQQSRNVICGRRAVPLYDLDLYLNRAADVNYSGGVSIMYNINRGVQFVGRPTEPPPYSEVITEPPREGPPPPYVSCENLIVRVVNPRFHASADVTSGSEGLPFNRNMVAAPETIPSDTDVRSSSGGVINGPSGERNNVRPNVPGPQVPTSSFPPRGLDTLPDLDSRAYNTSYDNGDVLPVDSSDCSRTQPTAYFEVEYVETDALLTDDKSHNGMTDPSCSQEGSSSWKPYDRHKPVKSRWLSNERRDKSIDHNWYRETIDTGLKERIVRGASSHKESENEGVFLDTDQQDSTDQRAESSCNLHNDSSNGKISLFMNIIESGSQRSENEALITASVSSNSACSNEVASGFPSLDGDQPSCKTSERRDDPDTFTETKEKMENVLLNEKKTKSETDHRVRNKTSSTRGIIRPTSFTNDDLSLKALSESSTCVSTASRGDLSAPRLDNDAPNNQSQICQSSLVLPLRESFIGVQRDS